MGGTRERRFVGTNPKPRNLHENAATPTTLVPAFAAGVHVVDCRSSDVRCGAVLGGNYFNRAIIRLCFFTFIDRDEQVHSFLTVMALHIRFKRLPIEGSKK